MTATAALYVAIAVSAAATATSAYAAYESGQSQKKAQEYNAKMAEYQAKTAREAAEARRQIYAKTAARRLATMRAQYGAAGVDISEGTPLLVLMESAGEAAKDELRIKYGGEADSWGLLAEAEQRRMAGRSAETQGYLGAGASLLGGASRGFSIYSGYKADIKQNKVGNH